MPSLAAHGIRLEFLAHLAATHSSGWMPTTRWRIKRWLNGSGLADAARMEDPPEDVFVSNVRAGGGDYLIFEGQWESADGHLQDLLDCLGRHRDSRHWRRQLHSTVQLLRLSNAIAERSGLQRWESPQGVDKSYRVDALPSIQPLRRRVIFTPSDLDELGISLPDLEPFILPETAREAMEEERFGHTSLERHPLLLIGGKIVCALPAAISVAIRRYLVESALQSGKLSQLSDQLRGWQERELFRELLTRIGTLPVPPGAITRKDEDGHGLSMAILPLDRDAIAVVALLHDDLSAVASEGLDSFEPLAPGLENAMLKQMELSARQSQFVLGVLVFGGLGRGRFIGIESLPDRCGFTAISLPDLRTFASAEGASLLRLAKLDAESDGLQGEGVQIVNMSGTLNLYAYWEHQGFSLLPDEARPGEHQSIYVAPNFLFEVRETERRKTDRHLEALPGGDAHVAVERLHANVYFPSRAMLPVYVAPDLLEEGQLAGLVRLSSMTVWVTAVRPDDRRVSSYLYKIWEALLDWLERASEAIRAAGLTADSPPTLELRLIEEASWAEMLGKGEFGDPAEPDLEVQASRARLHLPLGLLALLNRPENDGERALLVAALHALAEISDRGGPSRELAETIADSVMGGTAGRTIHVFRARRPVDFLPPTPKPMPRMLQPEDRAAARTARAWRVVDPVDGELVISTEGEAETLLHGLVDVLWDDISAELASLDREDVIALAIENGEGIFRDRDQWRHTARAVLSLSRDKDEAFAVAGERESLRAISGVANRVLVEMALCTSPLRGGTKVGWRVFDRVTAMIAELIETATHWDAIRGGLTTPQLVVRPSGRLQVDTSYIADVSGPFFRGVFDRGFSEAAEDYEDLYAPVADDTQAPWSIGFQTAFDGEYGFSLDTLFEVVGCLVDLALDKGSLVVRTTNRAIWNAVERQRNIDRRLARRVLERLILPARGAWDTTPPGFTGADWYPWRFKRRLSLSLRPLVALGEKGSAPVLYGVHQLASSVSYWVEGVRAAQFPSEHFQSAGMFAYLGETTQDRGHRFVRSVSQRLEACGWETVTEVMVSTMGGPEALGDIDVFAWRADNPRILVIECKSLVPRRNTYELVEELLDFRGEATDRLGRHVKRVEWVRESLQEVKTFLRAPESVDEVAPLFVTNRDVPMRYVRGLPLEPEQFVTLEQIGPELAT